MIGLKLNRVYVIDGFQSIPLTSHSAVKVNEIRFLKLHEHGRYDVTCKLSIQLTVIGSGSDRVTPEHQSRFNNMYTMHE